LNLVAGGSGERLRSTRYVMFRYMLTLHCSGLTPHWQLIHSILKNNKDDHTQIKMVDANSGLSVCHTTQ
jgi:hypothetical protein